MSRFVLLLENHLISHSQNGIEIQCYCAIIACLLINLWTGRKPTKRTFEMLSYYFTGLASEHELVAHLDKLKAHDEALTKNQSTTTGESCKQARLAMNAARAAIRTQEQQLELLPTQ